MMHRTTPPWRLPLLAAALLSACAAGGTTGSGGPVSGGPPISGAFGAYLAGRFAASETDTRAAADNLLAALRADPDQPELVARAFAAALLDGRADAVRLARRLPDQWAANLLLAGGDIQAGRWDRAEQRIRALPRQAGNQQLLGPVLGAMQPILLAWTSLGRGQADQALAVLRPLAEGSRTNPLAPLAGALIADIAGRQAEAQRFMRLALEAPEPGLSVTTLGAGVLARAGRAQDAQRLLDRMADMGEDQAMVAAEGNRRALLAMRGVAGPADGIAEAYVQVGQLLRGQGGADMALVLAQLAQRLRPGFSRAVILAADTVADQNHEAQALDMLAGVPDSDPMAPAIALRRALLLDRLDRQDEAAAALRRLADAYPRMAQPLVRLGDLQRRRERFAEAARSYDEAVARTGTLRGRDWPLLYARGIAHERSNNWPAAEADFLKALDLSPDQPLVLNYLGYSWAEQGRNLERAKAMLLRATERRPQDGNIADSLGWVLFRLGDLRGAVQWLEKAVVLEPRSSVINDHLGDAYWAIGRQREAQFQWRRALALEPEPGEGPKIEAKLRNGLPGYPAAQAQR